MTVPLMKFTVLAPIFGARVELEVMKPLPPKVMSASGVPEVGNIEVMVGGTAIANTTALLVPFAFVTVT